MTEKERTNQVDIEDEVHALKQAKITAIHELAKSQQNTMAKISDLYFLLADLSDSISTSDNDEQAQHLGKIKQHLDDWFAEVRKVNANHYYDFKVDTTPGLVRGDIDGIKQ